MLATALAACTAASSTSARGAPEAATAHATCTLTCHCLFATLSRASWPLEAGQEGSMGQERRPCWPPPWLLARLCPTPRLGVHQMQRLHLPPSQWKKKKRRHCFGTLLSRCVQGHTAYNTSEGCKLHPQAVICNYASHSLVALHGLLHGHR
jgi:hypothetical protein